MQEKKILFIIAIIKQLEGGPQDSLETDCNLARDRPIDQLPSCPPPIYILQSEVKQRGNKSWPKAKWWVHSKGEIWTGDFPAYTLFSYTGWFVQCIFPVARSAQGMQYSCWWSQGSRCLSNSEATPIMPQGWLPSPGIARSVPIYLLLCLLLQLYTALAKALKPWGENMWQKV